MEEKICSQTPTAVSNSVPIYIGGKKEIKAIEEILNRQNTCSNESVKIFTGRRFCICCIYLFYKLFFKCSCLGFLAVLAGSIIPDVLEPPTSWTHRDLFHSVRALKFAAIVFVLMTLIGLHVSLIYSAFTG